MVYDESKLQLQFNDGKQEALLGHLLVNERFFLQARLILKPEWFVNPTLQKFLREKLAFFEKWKRAPTTNELLDRPIFRQEDQATQNALRAKVGICLTRAADEWHLDKLQEELTNWLRSCKIQETFFKAEQVYNLKRDDSIEKAGEILKGFGRTFDDIKFQVTSGAADFSDIGIFADVQKLRGEGLTFGLKKMDELMNPHGGSGGLFPGDTTLLLAATNIGKTTAMITVANANITAGKDVLFITHEGQKTDIMLKFWMGQTGKTQRELFDLYNRGEWHVDQALRLLPSIFTRRLMYLPLNRAGQKIDDVEGIIRRANDEWAANHGGKGFDLLVDDYPAKLTTSEQRGGGWARRQVDELIYNRFVDLGGELGFHCLVAQQANREASKINRGHGTEERLLLMEDASEAFGPMACATNVITLNRNPDSANPNIMTYLLCKSRSGPTGYAVVCTSKFECATTHSNDLPHSYYQGDANPGQRAHQLLQEYAGQMIPANRVTNYGFAPDQK